MKSQRRRWTNVWSDGDSLSGVGGLFGLWDQAASVTPGSLARYAVKRTAIILLASLLATIAVLTLAWLMRAPYSSVLAQCGAVSAATALVMLTGLLLATVIDLFVIPVWWASRRFRLITALLFFLFAHLAVFFAAIAWARGEFALSWWEASGYIGLCALGVAGHVADQIIGRAVPETYPHVVLDMRVTVESSGATAEDASALGEVASWLSESESHFIVVESFVEAEGDTVSNYFASLARARAIKDRLVSKGCSPMRVGTLTVRPFPGEVENEYLSGRLVRLVGMIVSPAPTGSDSSDLVLITVHGVGPHHYRYWAAWREEAWRHLQGCNMIAFKWDAYPRGWSSVAFGFAFSQVVTFLFWRCDVIYQLGALFKRLDREVLSIVSHSMGALLAYEAWYLSGVNARLMTLGLGFAGSRHRCRG